MSKNRPLLFLLLIALLAFTMACTFLDQLLPSQEPAVPAEEHIVPTDEPVQPTPEPTATEEPVPTETPPNHGQILYMNGGNIWRYLVDEDEIIQMTFDGTTDNYETSYRNPLFSADGHYASYERNGVSYIHKFEDNSVISLPVRVFQWSQTQDATFYAAIGSFECPAVENLEDQEQINFDLLRYEVGNLEAPTLLANITGGLFFPKAISNDEQYASILYCACYSECGSQIIHHLPSATPLSAPEEVYPESVDFSPDSSRLVTSNQQYFGYFESPLYLGNSDFSGAIKLFDEPKVAVNAPRWSPNGDQIAFTALDIGEEYDLAGSRVLITNLDGTVQLEIAADHAQFSTWSPDASQILFYRGEWGAYTPFIYDLLSGSTTALPFTFPYNELDWGVLP